LRKLKTIDVNFISLVDKGANRKKLIFKSLPDTTPLFEKTVQIKKYDEDQRIVFCIVYSPDEVDTQGDIATAEVIKEAAYNFMRCARTNNVDKQHDFIPDEGFVAESWIVKENDSIFPDEPAGSWAVGIKVENDETWQSVKNGEITGLSLAGLAVIEDSQNNSPAEKADDTIQDKGLNELQDWFQSSCEKQNSEILEKEKLNDEAFKSLNSRIAQLETSISGLQVRIEYLEKSTVGSRQIRKEEFNTHEQIKIWT
jgi:hypothetical protein